MKPSLTLFGRQECGLCDQAEQMLLALQLDYSKADIGGNLQWMERYRDTIPVIRYGETELNWPFSIEQLKQLAGAQR